MNEQNEILSVGRLISSKRKQRGLTQYDVANKLRVSEQAVSKWERDLSRPGLKVSNELRELLGITQAEVAEAQKATPRKYKMLQLAGNYVTFAIIVSALVLSVVGTVLLVLNQIDLKDAVILLGIAVVLSVVLLFDSVDTKLSF